MKQKKQQPPKKTIGKLGKTTKTEPPTKLHTSYQFRIHG
jgi:hypothetical protein